MVSKKLLLCLLSLILAIGKSTAQSCTSLESEFSISDYEGTTLGNSSYDNTNRIFYAHIFVNSEYRLFAYDVNTGTSLLLGPTSGAEPEFVEQTGMFYSIGGNSGNNMLRRYDLDTSIEDDVLLLEDLCGISLGTSTSNPDGQYIFRGQFATDCENGSSISKLIVIDVSINQIVSEFEDVNLNNIEYDVATNSVLGLLSENGAIYLSRFNLTTGLFDLSIEIPSLESYSTAVSGYDHVNGRYIFSGTNLIDGSDPENPITEPLLYLVDVNGGITITAPPVNLTEFKYDEETNTYFGLNGSGVVQSLNVSDCFPEPSYELPEMVIPCSQTIFNTPLTTTSDAVSNIIGYDITVTYDPTYLTPTGNLTIPSDLINPSYVSALLSDNNGEILISLALNGSAPAGTFWMGTGELFQLEFENLGTLGSESTEIAITRMEESYLAGTEGQVVEAGSVMVETDELFESALVEASSGNPIGNDVNTVIFGTDVDCSDLGVFTTNPAVDGSFSVDVSMATNIAIIRDIDNTTDMMPVIGGDDALTLQKTLVNHPDIITTPPSISQMMAMDVNMDGRVTAGDLTQLNQRTVGSIDEFRQAWNYDNTGVSNGTPSLDWGFMDELLLSEPAYTLSSSFPDDDGVGYSKINVPVFKLCQEIPISGDASCPEITDTQFVGVLLGDIDGTVASKLGEGNFRTESTYEVVVNLEQSELTPEGHLAIPVSVVGENIQNLDLNLQFNNEKMQYKNIGKLAHKNLQYFDHLKTDRELRLTSYSLQTYSNKKPSFFIEFATSEKSISAASFKSGQAYIKGERASITIKGTAELKKLKQQLNDSFDDRVVMFPNPSTELISVNFQDELKDQVYINIFDVFGKEVTTKQYSKTTDSFGATLDLKFLKRGMYVVEVRLGQQVSRRRIVRE